MALTQELDDFMRFLLAQELQPLFNLARIHEYRPLLFFYVIWLEGYRRRRIVHMGGPFFIAQ